MILSGLIILLVFGLIVGFAFRYRNGSRANRGPLPEWMQRDFEIGWTAATVFLFLFIAWFTAAKQSGQPRAPERRHADPCRRQAMDVEDAAAERRARDQRAACADQHAGRAA